ncbi:MAG: glycosyltransferase, partial [Actinomycetota bacterium]
IAVVIAWLKHRPVIYYAADVWTDGVISMGASQIVVSIMRFMERTVLRRAAAVISVSAEVTERLVLLRADPSKITTVGNGIDTDVFSPDVEMASEERYFVYTGTMSEWQQPEIFVRAFALLATEEPDLRLRFFGQGSVENELRRIADELVPGKVEFGGVVRPSESASWIRGAIASLVSIVPGIGYDFAKPTKTYAAAAVGTPVLFAGPEAGSALVEEAELGHAVRFTPESVAAGMRSLLTEAADGTSERLRSDRVRWARSNVSLDAVADRVTVAISQVLPKQTAKLEFASEHTPDGDERPTK